MMNVKSKTTVNMMSFEDYNGWDDDNTFVAIIGTGFINCQKLSPSSIL